MNDEWIYGCGVRFWGQAQVTEAVWNSWVGGVLFSLLAVAGLATGVGIAIKGGDWVDRSLGLLVALLALGLFVVPINLINDALCYSKI